MHLDSVIRELKESYYGLKVRELIFRRRFPRNYAPLPASLQRFKNCACRKPTAQIRKEILLLKRFWGCYPWQYFLYDLYRFDQALSEDQLLNYVPEFFFYELFLRHHNPQEFRWLFSDKAILEQLLRSVEIAQPLTLAKIINGCFYTKVLDSISCAELLHKIQRETPDRVVVKPLDGQGGRGVLVFHKANGGGYTTKNGASLTVEWLESSARTENFIVQEGIEQIPAMAAVYPHSVNTFRITSENLRSEVRLLTSSTRFGRGGIEVDNISQAGINVRVDLDTGRLDALGFTKEQEVFAEHPDTGVSFGSLVVPDWDRFKLMVKTFAAKLPHVPYLGWDVALDNEGPLIIEVNFGFGIDAQNIHHGLRNVLRIKEPQFYWTNRGHR